MIQGEERVSKAISTKVDSARAIIADKIPLSDYFNKYKYKMDSQEVGFLNCPIHEERTASLSYDSDKGVYQCFGCGSKGTIVEFVVAMEQKTNPNYNAVRAILKLSREFNVTIPDMFTYEKSTRPKREIVSKFKKEDVSVELKERSYNTKLERLEVKFNSYPLSVRLELFNLIDKMFLKEASAEDTYKRVLEITTEQDLLLRGS